VTDGATRNLVRFYAKYARAGHRAREVNVALVQRATQRTLSFRVWICCHGPRMIELHEFSDTFDIAIGRWLVVRRDLFHSRFRRR